MYTGIVNIDEVLYEFTEDGKLIGEVEELEVLHETDYIEVEKAS